MMYTSPINVHLNPGSNSVYVQNNAMCGTWDSGQLLNYEYYNGWNDAAIFTGNTFIMKNGFAVATVCTKSNDSSESSYIVINDNISYHLKENLGDAKANVITRKFTFCAPE